MTEDIVFIRILQAAAKLAGASLRDPDAANLFTNPLFDDGTPEGKRIPMGVTKIEDSILWHPEGSGARDNAQRALGHYIRRELEKPPG